jgi:hypothetical protein
MPIVEELLQLTESSRQTAVKREHPQYKEFAHTWDVLANAFDGIGGFKDGSYLLEFPREDSTKYNGRKQQARYHNYVESLAELFTRYLTRNVDRTTTSEELKAWWDDVDGKGTSMADLVRDIIMQGLASGHVGVLVDKPDVEPGETRATDSAQPFVSLYPPLTIQDWIWDARDGIHAVKLRESITPESFNVDDQEAQAAFQYLLWDREMWARFDQEGDWIPGEAGENLLGRVPFEVFRPKRMKRFPFLGRPLINAKIISVCFFKNFFVRFNSNSQSFNLSGHPISSKILEFVIFRKLFF